MSLIRGANVFHQPRKKYTSNIRFTYIYIMVAKLIIYVGQLSVPHIPFHVFSSVFVAIISFSISNHINGNTVSQTNDILGCIHVPICMYTLSVNGYVTSSR